MKNRRGQGPGRFALAVALSTVLVIPPGMFAGGPVMVGGPQFGIPGQPLVWDSSKPITYRVDTGPLSQLPNGGAVMVNNAA